MDESKIIEILSETRAPRATIYLNVKRVDELYNQSVSAITELVKSRAIGLEGSAGIWGVFSSKVAADNETTGGRNITPILKAILIEYKGQQSDQLIDMSIEQPQPGFLLKYVGHSRIVFDEMTTEATGLPENVVNLIQNERVRQEKILQLYDENLKTIAWLTAMENRILASIVSTEWIDFGHLASYGPLPSFGILGRYENVVENVTFVSPLWIWHEGW